jgi:DNA-binding MarR family transcriptional regulator
VERGSITSTELAGIVHLSPSTIVGIVDRLEGKGLLSRERDRKDRRRILLTASEAGCELARQAPSPLQDTFSTAFSELPAGEQAELARAVERIVDLMEVRHLDAAPILETGPIDQSGTDPDPK